MRPVRIWIKPSGLFRFSEQRHRKEPTATPTRVPVQTVVSHACNHR
jgi:hypothetical protein